MPSPSPYSHLIRAVGLLILAGFAFVIVRMIMVPPSWNSKVWFREDSLVLLAEQPLTYGGNESCAGCHEDKNESHKTVIEEMAEGAHKNLSCESCHGPLAHHVRDDKKIAEARIEYSGVVCLNCHDNLLSKPAQHPKFILAKETIPERRAAELLEAAKEKEEDEIFRHKTKVHPYADCVDCHESFHDPET